MTAAVGTGEGFESEAVADWTDFGGGTAGGFGGGGS